MILSCHHISKSFGSNVIIKDASFHIEEREKAAIVGINGAGKSTLLKIIMEQLTPDSGEVILAKGATIGYLSQHQELSSHNSIYEEILTAKAEIIQMEQQIRTIEVQMKQLTGQELEQMLNTYTRLTHEFEMQNGYAYKSECVGILKGLGFEEDDFNRGVSTLSGGQKTRVALGKLLVTKPDIILLDEPTNHLDIRSIEWLETFLQNYNGTVIIVAHDRYFLDRVVTQVIEMESGMATSFQGNYSQYVTKKEMLTQAKLKAYENQQQEIKHQEQVITKLKSFNREKSIKRAESREKMLDKIERIEKPLVVESKMNITLEPSKLSGNDVLTVRGLTKSFTNLPLFDHLDFDIKRGETVAIIGENGTGKTTLLKIINQVIPMDSGEIQLGSNVEIGYYDQEHQILHMEKTLFDEISDSFPDLTNTKIRNTLAAFLFTEDDVFKKIGSLSGGERARVSLAKLMLSDANFLILDEPTNHLDIESKEILEQVISNYTGTVLYVSHDRYFVNKTADRILDLKNHTLVNYIGNYDYYLEKREALTAIYTTDTSSQKDDASDSIESKLDWKQQKEEQAKQRKREKRLKQVEEEIDSLEQRDEEIDLLLTTEEVFTNVETCIELNKEKVTITDSLAELYKEWEELSI